MYRWQKLVVGIIVVGVLLALLPFALQAIPPRYITRYAPEPIQALVLPQQEVAILPTVVPLTDAATLLDGESALPTLPPTRSLVAYEPATPTPLPVAGEPTAVPPTPTIPPTPTSTVPPIPTTARLENVRHYFQDWNNCGPATLAMTLSYFDLNLTQSDTARVLKPSAEDRNVTPAEMAAFVQNETDLQAVYRVNGRVDTVKRLIAAGIPVILEIGIEPPGEFRWMGWYGHYMLVVAYDDDESQFWVYDSWLGTSETPLENAHEDGRLLSYADLARDWPHFNRNYIVVYRPEQAELVAAILGTEMDDGVMWRNSLQQARADAAADPENPFYWFNLGTSHNALGEHEQAALAFDQARAIGLPWRMLWYQFGPYEAYVQSGRYEDVILLADATLKDRPYFEESFYYKAVALQALGDSDAAAENFRRAAEFNPNFTPAVDALAAVGE